MISYHFFVRRIETERHRLRRVELQTEFMRGMVEGLSLALVFAKELWLASLGRMVNNPKGKSK